MNLVNTQDLVKIRTIMTPEQQKAEQALVEAKALALAAPVTIAATGKATSSPATVAVTGKTLEESVLSEAAEEKTSKNRPPRKAENMTPKTKKLVLDQPDRVTVEGKVEQFVREDGVSQLNDNDNSKQPKPDILLNENPVGEIIIE